jgi:DNA-binding SARP family transcriptional activator
MRVTVLGAAAVQRAGHQVDLGGPKVRSLLAALALYAGRPVSPDRIIDLLWQRDPPPAVTASLQTYVAKLRRAVEPDRAARAPSTVLLTSTAGYALHLPPGVLDCATFRKSIGDIHHRLLRPVDRLPRTPPGLTVDDLWLLRAELTAVLDLWSGTPFLDLPDDDVVLAERAGLAALRLVALEDLALVRVALGEESAVAVDLEPLVLSHPLLESLWAVRILALARSGQQQGSLAAARLIRRSLADELGVDPGPMLQDLERAVLQQSAELWWRPTEGSRSVHRSASSPVDQLGETPTPVTVVDPTPMEKWPLIGRHSEIEQLQTALARAETGSPAVAMLIGEPGIGKSRLLRELSSLATKRGFLVAGGSCSQDDGAPALWPWSRILAVLDEAKPVAAADRIQLMPGPGAAPTFADSGDRWDLWEAVLRRLLIAAATAPLLVLVDDLHWADPASLILLRHLVERLADPAVGARIAIVLARRRFPEPRGPLAALGETLARTGAQRLEIGGLQPAEIEQLGDAATGTRMSLDRAVQLFERTGGNAFFVTELIRLSLQNEGRAASEIPSAVSDVVLSRLSVLPGPTRRIVGVAAVIGRDFDAVLLAAVTDNEVDDILDLLDPALATGLVMERDAGRFQFSHALVRDAVNTSLSATRRSLRHADIAAALDRGQSLDLRGGRSEAARHWLAAGPQHAATAWRAAAAAAADAMALLAWEEAAGLLTEALAAAEMDPTAIERDRYDLRMRLADACRWSGDRAGMDAALRAAIADAEQLGEVELVARAAIGSLEGSAWFPRAYAEVETERIRTLRNALRRLPSQDSELRCRVMLALAIELYYADAPQEIDALTEQGLAMARRIDDAALLVWATTAAYQATWKPSTAELRYGWIAEALTAAIALGDARTEAVTRYLLAGAAQETGRIDQMREQIAVSRSLALQHRLATVEVALGWLEAPWLALQGDYAEAYALIAHTAQTMNRTSMNQQSEALAGTVMNVQVIQGQLDKAAVERFSMAASNSEIPMSANVLVVLLRAGRLAEVQERYAAQGLTLGPETWFSLISDSLAAEVAAEVGDPELAMQVYRRLAPFAGRPATAAASSAIWPVDWFLAVAAAATGEKQVATAHADAAERLCHSWRIEPAIGWIHSQRRRFGF